MAHLYRDMNPHFPSPSVLERVRYVDGRLEELGLSQAQTQQVREHRVRGVNQRQQRIAELGPCPDTSAEQTVWDKRKQAVEQQLELELQSERLVTEGLEEAWERFQERDKLKKLKDQLLESSTGNGAMPLASAPGAAEAGQAPGFSALTTNAVLVVKANYGFTILRNSWCSLLLRKRDLQVASSFQGSKRGSWSGCNNHPFLSGGSWARVVSQANLA